MTEINAFEETFGRKPPTHYIVCPACRGRGVMTLKRLAIPAEMFEEDPDFYEDYRNGVYDEPCDECQGRTTVLVIDEESLSDEQKQFLEEYRDEEAEYRHLLEMERRAGC